MSTKNDVSRNREDYPAEVRAIIHATADVFHDGDLDKAWEAFFVVSETNSFATTAVDIHTEAETAEAHIHMPLPH